MYNMHNIWQNNWHLHEYVQYYNMHIYYIYNMQNSIQKYMSIHMHNLYAI